MRTTVFTEKMAGILTNILQLIITSVKKCLEETERKKQLSVNQGEDVPDWAKTITTKVAGYGRY